LVGMVVRQQRLRLRAENELLIQQSQSYLFQKALGELELKSIHSEKEILESKLVSKRKEIEEMAINIAEQRTFLNAISSKIKLIFSVNDPAATHYQLAELQAMVKQRITFTEESRELNERIGLLQSDFLNRLSERFPGLSARERRLATLIRIGLSNKEIGSLLSISSKGVEIGRYRLKRKMNVSKEITLQEFIHQI
jgi:inorganic phosphate transporter, PiT family